MELEADLDAGEAEVYDRAARFWRHLERALKEAEPHMPEAPPAAGGAASSRGTSTTTTTTTGSKPTVTGDPVAPTQHGKSSKEVWKSFWSTQQVRGESLACVTVIPWVVERLYEL